MDNPATPDDEAQARQDEAPPQENVVFYWRPGCGFCWALRRRLTAAGVPLDERNIWEDADAAAVVRAAARGDETVPTVVVTGRTLVNPTAARVLALVGHTPPPRGARLRSLLRRFRGRPRPED